MSEWAVFFGDTRNTYITRHVMVQANSEVEALEAAEKFARPTEYPHAARLQPTWEGPTPLKS